MTDFKEKGNAALKSGDLNLALNYYNQAVDAEPSNHVHYSNRSLCHLKLGKLDDALHDANKCIHLDSKWAKGYLRKGSVELKLNKPWNAFVAFSLGKVIEPENSPLNTELQNLFTTMKSTFQTQIPALIKNPSVTKLMQDPKNMKDLMNVTPDLIFNKGRENEDFVDVISLVLHEPRENVLSDIKSYFDMKDSIGHHVNENKPNPEDPLKKQSEQSNHYKAENAYHRANELYVLEEYESALEFYDIAHSKEHNNINFLLNRAACYLQTGDDVLALEDCKAANKIKATSRAYYLEIKAYLMMKNNSKAQEVQKEALQNYPNDEKIKSLL